MQQYRQLLHERCHHFPYLGGQTLGPVFPHYLLKRVVEILPEVFKKIFGWWKLAEHLAECDVALRTILAEQLQ